MADETYGDAQGGAARLIDSTDARLWASEWCRIAREITTRGDSVIDEGWMIGWFANALATADRLGGWTRFYLDNEASWPPEGLLVHIYDASLGYAHESIHRDPDDSIGVVWYDENSDYNDGWDPTDERWWRLLPPPPDAH